MSLDTPSALNSREGKDDGRLFDSIGYTAAHTWDNLWKSAVQGSVEAPVTAVGQMFDPNFNWEPIKPSETKTGSFDYYVQGVGSAVGFVADFALLKGGLGRLGKTGLAADLNVAPVLRNPTGLTSVSGGIYGGVFTPIDPAHGNQIGSRIKNGALTAATFTGMESLSKKLVPLAKSDNFLGQTSKTIGVNAAIGAPIGVLNSQAHSLLFDKKLAGLSETGQAGLDWAVIGGVLSAPGAIRGIKSPPESTAREFKVKPSESIRLDEPDNAPPPVPSINDHELPHQNFPANYEAYRIPRIDIPVPIPPMMMMENPLGRALLAGLADEPNDWLSHTDRFALHTEAFKQGPISEPSPRAENPELLEDRLSMRECMSLERRRETQGRENSALIEEVSNRGPICKVVAEEFQKGIHWEDARALVGAFWNAGYGDRYRMADIGEHQRFADTWLKLQSVRNWQDLPSNPNFVRQMAQAHHLDTLSAADTKAVYGHVLATGCIPETRVPELLEKATISWRIDPSLPEHLALELSSAPLQERLASHVAWEKVWNEVAHDQNPSGGGKALRAFERWNAQLQGKEASALTRLATSKKLLPIAVEAIDGKVLSKKEQAALAGSLERSDDPFKALNQIRPQTFKDALRQLSPRLSPQIAAESATKLSLVFGPRWNEWLSSQKLHQRYPLEASRWLPMNGRGDLRALRAFLFAHGNEDTTALATIASGWPKIRPEDRHGSFEDVFNQALDYDNVTDRAFALEAGKWNVSPRIYNELEARYRGSLEVPVPFPVEERWTAGDLTGRFLPRNDPRGLFLGRHTNCCQRPGDVAESSAWFGQTNPKSGFFVVEDPSGKIVAQSWTWISDQGGVVFDSVEGSGLTIPAKYLGLETHEKKLDSVKNVRDIYQKAADELSKKHGIVTLGTSHSNDLDRIWNPAGKKTQPLLQHTEENLYSDANNLQRLLADSTDPNSQ